MNEIGKEIVCGQINDCLKQLNSEGLRVALAYVRTLVKEPSKFTVKKQAGVNV